MELTKHWAENLQAGDRAKATIRHKTDGSKNIHNASIIIVNNLPEKRAVVGAMGLQELEVPYNELSQD